MSSAPPVTWLYVPADRPDRVEKALVSRAHVVIVDLEDAVAPAAKERARAGLASLLGAPVERLVHVRVNAAGSPWFDADVEAVAGLAVDGVTLPKADSPASVAALAGALAGKRLHCLLESARGLEEAYGIASVPGVSGISLGEVDLGAETGATGAGLDWARGRVVNAAVAAGLPRPAQPVYAAIRDLDGLRRTCLEGRAFGFFGREAIHPDQLEAIEEVYLPSADEVGRARELLAGFSEQEADGVGAYLLGDGSFVDAAFVRRAREVVSVAETYGTR